MKYLLNSQGTVGDVRPVIALGAAMQNAGYDVIIGAPPNSSDLVLKYKLPFRPIGIDLQKYLNEQMHNLQGNPIKYMSSLKNIMLTPFSKQFDDLLQSAADCDYIISCGVDFSGYSIGEYYKIPWRFVTHVPLGFQSKFHPPPMVKNQNMPHWLNQISWYSNNITFGLIESVINKLRKKVGMGKITTFSKKFLNRSIVAADSLIMPMPTDVKDDYTQTGYFFLNDNDDLDNELEQFINDGSPPIYIGFGSMIDTNPLKTSGIIKDLIQSDKYRFIISKGYAKLTPNENHRNTYFIDYVPHAKLFPKMAIIIHHGGAGTIHTAARAGVPQIVVPHIGDQYYSANRVFKLNLGSKPIYRSHLSSKKLITVIDEIMSNKELQNNAKTFSEHLKNQNGIYEMINILKNENLK
jgi:UDP:flavonoid glycosyltransferase YjiC (YdhE family)